MIEIGSSTHLGNIRQINEDALFVQKGDGFTLLIIADGMGGHNAGEVASQMAIDKIAAYLTENPNESQEDRLRTAICFANREIYHNAIHVHKNHGMGTTVVAAIINADGDTLIANVGDSRAYVLSNGALKQITKDHSYVQQLIDKDLISAQDARKHPSRNMITRAVGTSMRVVVDTFKLKLQADSRLLLCTDGLTAHVQDKALKKTLSSQSEAKTLVYLLEKQALKNGGTDNITMIIAKVKG